MTLPHDGWGREPEDGRPKGPETAGDLLPGCRLGRFRVLETVHHGDMGTVVRALDEEMGREVALKVLPARLAADPQFHERFVHEARAVACLDHPSICPIYSVGSLEGRLYVAMHFVHGTTLGAVIRQFRQFTPHGALQVVRNVAEALGVVHRAGLLHRDVTSSNIMIEPGGQIRLVDFGLTGFAFNPPSFAPGAYVGTPEYSSPEQCAGGDLDATSDLYSLGIVLYEMLTGRVPFVDEDPVRLFRRLREESPIPIRALNPRVPKGVIAMFERLTARDRRQRYADAAAVVAAADELLEATPGPRSVFELVRARGPRPAWVRPAVAVLIVGIACAVLWDATRRASLTVVPRMPERQESPSSVAQAPTPSAPAAAETQHPVVWKAVILPFERVGGEVSFAWLSEGLPDLLARALRERRGVEAIERGAFLAAIGTTGGKPWTLAPHDGQVWAESAEPASWPCQVASAMDALGVAFVVSGRFTGDTARVRIEAEIRLSAVAAVDPSRPARTVAVQGRPEDLLALVDRLVREIEQLLRDRAQKSSSGAEAG